MQKEFHLSEIHVRRYLERIGVNGDMRADYHSIRLIQERHMLSIPFENLNIVRKLPIELDLCSLYDKIVTRRRGGYCYELNGLLAWILKWLGYPVTILSGQVHRGDGTFGPEFDRMILLVHLNDEYIVDVGFGDSVRSPLPLSGKIVDDASGSYRIIHEYESSFLFFQKKLDGDWVSEFRFT